MMQGEEGNMGGDRMGMDKMGMRHCNCPHHKMIPLFIFVFGLLFFLNAINVLTGAALTMLWPIVVMLAGLTKLFSSKCGCCKGGMCR